MMVLINGIQLEQHQHVLKIAFKDEVLNEWVRADFQAVNTQFGEYHIFAIANEDYWNRKDLFATALLNILPHLQEYLIAETGCNMNRIIMDHQSQLIYT